MALHFPACPVKMSGEVPDSASWRRQSEFRLDCAAHMFEEILQWAMPAVGGVLLLLTLRYRRLTAAWTVDYSVRWSAVAVAAVVLAGLSSTGLLPMGPGWRGTLQYLAAILLLTPSICTLGARRPGAGPWQWFVVLPMILVLIWPVFTQAVDTSGRSLVQLSNPQLCGVCLAALMGLGPGLGTSTAAVLLRLAALILALLPLRTSDPWTTPAAQLVPLVLLAELLISEQRVRGHMQRLQQATTDEQRSREIWLLFQTLYGSVWPRRVQDRMSQFERGECWTVTLTDAGFRQHSGSTPGEAELARPLEAFRWLLGRFVTTAWLATQLPVKAEVPGQTSGGA